MNRAKETLDAIAYRLEDRVADGDITGELRDVYLIAIGRKCPFCEAEPGDREYCVVDGSAHPWVASDT